MSAYSGNNNSSHALIKKNEYREPCIKNIICKLLCCCFPLEQKVEPSQSSDRSYATTTSTSSSSDEDNRDPLITENTIRCNTTSQRNYGEWRY